MTRHSSILAGLAVLIGLLCASEADAQLLWRWFGPKTTEKSPPVQSTAADLRRLTEASVEIAWLADPVTFPYYLEAHIQGSKLEVRGYVPSKAVREHALRIAQVYSSLPVADSLREHPSLLVKSSQMSPQELQRSAQSSLRVALPKQSQNLKVECGADGKVFVLGTVKTVEEKMAVSNSLRRLHGCTSVQNLTMVRNGLAEGDQSAIITTSAPPPTQTDKPAVRRDAKPKSWLQWPWTKNVVTTREEPPLLEPEPRMPQIKEMPQPPANNTLTSNQKPANAPKTPLTVSDLQKRIQAACPRVKGVEVQFAANREVRITLELGTEREISSTAERVFALPELQNYRPELQFRITSQ